ncbi:hypothetical protein JTE90_027063 [Oedothorax gibbosus]|uniref:Uncharacterized protein n=1 Tax=Oedothorax gibbosus TaxID=931172 RepID=A0AAV6TSF6_9ARAC|nr:hypothetical protein JTE90_027063 [Oedothorax gibbosus]
MNPYSLKRCVLENYLCSFGTENGLSEKKCHRFAGVNTQFLLKVYYPENFRRPEQQKRGTFKIEEQKGRENKRTTSAGCDVITPHSELRIPVRGENGGSPCRVDHQMCIGIFNERLIIPLFFSFFAGRLADLVELSDSKSKRSSMK